MLWVGGGAQLPRQRNPRPGRAHRRPRRLISQRPRHHRRPPSPLSMTVASAYKLWPKTDLLVAFGTRLEVPTSRWSALPAGLKRSPASTSTRSRCAASRPTSRSLQTSAPTPPAPWRPLPRPRSDPARAEAIAQAKADAAQAIQKVQPQMSFLDVIRDVLPENGIFCDRR